MPCIVVNHGIPRPIGAPFGKKQQSSSRSNLRSCMEVSFSWRLGARVIQCRGGQIVDSWPLLSTVWSPTTARNRSRRASDSWKTPPCRTWPWPTESSNIWTCLMFFIGIGIGYEVGTLPYSLVKLSSWFCIFERNRNWSLRVKHKLMMSWSTTLLSASRTEPADHSFWNVPFHGWM